MDKQKAANLLDKFIQCNYLQYVDGCPEDVPCKDCEYNTDQYDTMEIIEAMKMALEALEGDTENIKREHETTTFEQSRRALCVIEVYACSKCGQYVCLSTYYKEHVFDYNYCPYCGKPVAKE